MFEPSTSFNQQPPGARSPGGETAHQGRARPRFRRRRALVLAFACLVVLALLGAGGLILGSGTRLRLPLSGASGQPQAVPAAPLPIVGHLFFESSGQVSLQSSAGIADEAQLDLAHLAPLPQGKRYYAWLVSGSVEGRPVQLGSLSPSAGEAHLFYPGTASHTNLLTLVNRLLITEEDATAASPLVPTPDKSAWVYASAFSQAPNPRETPPYSLLAHLQHLLSTDPILDDPAIALHGGLDVWLFRDAQKILEWSGSARDAWGKGAAQAALIHRQLVRIMEYLDGWRYALRELPPGTPLLVDERIALVAMRELNVADQEPPGLLYHIGQHLHGIAESPEASRGQRLLATQIAHALTTVSGWLDDIHTEALALVMMTPAQLALPSTRSQLQTVATQASNAFSGSMDPATNALQEGVTQIHYAMPNLATMDVTAVQCATASPSSQQVALCL